MTYSDDLETIKKFALGDCDNLSTFLRICSCGEEVKAHLRDDFVSTLNVFLRQTLENDGWELEDQMSGKWSQSYPNILIYKKKFGLINYHVAVESWSRVARMMVYGVKNGGTKEKPSKPSQEKNNKIWEILNGEVAQGGRPTDWWSWYKYLEHPYDDWNNSEMLMKMFDSASLYQSKKEFDSTVKSIGQKLVQVTSALDTWFKSKGD